jgi:hypothetical protein
MAEQLNLFAKAEHGGLCAGCKLECSLRDQFEKDGLSLRVSLCSIKKSAGIELYRLIEDIEAGLVFTRRYRKSGSLSNVKKRDR